MDLLTLIETCSVAKDAPLVLAMALTFSAGNPYTVESTVQADEIESVMEEAERPEAPRNREAALAELRRLLDAGEDAVAGLLPATAKMARSLERPVEDLLDPCAGLGIATATVSAAEFDCAQARRKDQRQCVLQRYAADAGLEFFVGDVMSVIVERDIPDADAPMVLETTTITEAAVFSLDGDARTWGADRIFVSDRGAPPAIAAVTTPPSDLTPRTLKRRSTLRLGVAPMPPLPSVDAPRRLRERKQ